MVDDLPSELWRRPTTGLIACHSYHLLASESRPQRQIEISIFSPGFARNETSSGKNTGYQLKKNFRIIFWWIVPNKNC
jgi:hypothetical protein